MTNTRSRSKLPRLPAGAAAAATPATAARDGRAGKAARPRPPASPGRIAVDHLGTTAATEAVLALHRMVARMAGDIGHAGAPSQQVRSLERAAQALRKAVGHLRTTLPDQRIRAMRRAAGEQEENEGATVLDEFKRDAPYRQAAIGLDVPDRLARLAKELIAEAAAVPHVPRGHPASPGLDFALEALEAIWSRHRRDAPTQSGKAGGFSAFAQDLFSCPPCNFARDTIRHAVARRLRRNRRRRSPRGTTPEATRPELDRLGLPPPPADEVIGIAAEHRVRPPSSARVVLVAPDCKLASELARIFRDGGSEVSPMPVATEAKGRSPSGRVAFPPAPNLESLSGQAADTVIVVAPEFGKLAKQAREVAHPEAVGGHVYASLVDWPMRMLKEAADRLAKPVPARLILVNHRPSPPSPDAASQIDELRPFWAAQSVVIRQLQARWPTGVIVAAVTPIWPSPMVDRVLSSSTLGQVAAELHRVITNLNGRARGGFLDLGGTRFPV